MSNVLAYDFGTGGIKASVYQPDGECLVSHFAAYETKYPRPGWHEQDVEDWWQATVSATRRLLGEWDGAADSIAAIGISGHSLGLVALDAQGELLRPNAIIWYNSSLGICRSANRTGLAPLDPISSTGFRVVVSLD